MGIKTNIKYFDLLKPFPQLIHGFSTRVGGVSLPPFNTLNLGLHTGDDPKAVQQNRALFFNALGIRKQNVVFPEQVHSDTIRFVDTPGIVPHCDALITNRTNLFLSIQTADCFPVFVYDPVQKAVGIIHSGWRGTVKNIVGQTIRQFKARFHSEPERLLVAVGPGVQQSCYQIDEATAKYFHPKFLKPDGPEHFKLNLQGAIIEQIRDEGVPNANIEIDTDCTHCRSDLYYSYRRDGKQSGRMMGIIGILPIT